MPLEDILNSWGKYKLVVSILETWFFRLNIWRITEKYIIVNDLIIMMNYTEHFTSTRTVLLIFPYFCTRFHISYLEFYPQTQMSSIFWKFREDYSSRNCLLRKFGLRRVIWGVWFPWFIFEYKIIILNHRLIIKNIKLTNIEMHQKNKPLHQKSTIVEFSNLNDNNKT